MKLSLISTLCGLFCVLAVDAGGRKMLSLICLLVVDRILSKLFKGTLSQFRQFRQLRRGLPLSPLHIQIQIQFSIQQIQIK